jgi:hypothetical protein
MNRRTCRVARAFAALFLASFLTLIVPLSSIAQPSPKWVRFQDGYGKNDVIEDVVVDPAGGIYVAGWTINNSNDADYYVAKYDRYGTRSWYHLYDGGGDDVARSIAVKGSKVVVTGKSRGGGFGANYDILTFVLDTAGAIAPDSANASRFDYNRLGRDDDAVKVLFGPGSSGAGMFLSGVHADSAANDTFYVAGTHRDTLSQSDNLTILMYDNTGNIGVLIHSRRGDESVAGMEVTPDAIYVGATAVDSTGFGTSYETAKFDLRTVFEWQKVYRNIGNDNLLGLAADASGVYVTGWSRSACGDIDAATVGYAADGTLKWVNRSFDCASGQVGTGGILIDGSDVLAAGYHANGSQYYRIRTSDGTLVRTGDVWGTQSSWVGLVRSYDGNIYAGGNRIYYDMPAYAVHLAKFNSSDALQWDTQYDGSGSGSPNTIHKMIASPADSSIILAGSVTVNGQEDMMIVKYGVGESLTTGVGEGGDRDTPAGIPDEYALDQNYPNPFNSSTIIRFRLPERVPVTLKIYDMIGREAATLFEGPGGPGEQAVLFQAGELPSGVYIARLTAGSFTEIRKIVLMK